MPYRSLALAECERARCGWCRHSRLFGWACDAVPFRQYLVGQQDIYMMPAASEVNPHGACEAYEPGRLTRILRRVGLRRPRFREKIDAPGS